MPKASNEGAEKMIEIQNITKIYGKQTVLKNVTGKLEARGSTLVAVIDSENKRKRLTT